MPNWCYNSLSVSGSEEDIRKFKQAANGPSQSYNEFRSTDPEWPIHDDVRIKSLSQSLPESGPVQTFSFHALFPVPDDVRRFPYDGNQARRIGEVVGEARIHGGYEWECSNWGVKWGASESRLDCEEPLFLQYVFDTAWAPPEVFLDKVSQDWPTLHFELSYEEPGMGFAGDIEWEDGEQIYHDSRELEDEDCDEEEDE